MEAKIQNLTTQESSDIYCEYSKLISDVKLATRIFCRKRVGNSMRPIFAKSENLVTAWCTMVRNDVLTMTEKKKQENISDCLVAFPTSHSYCEVHLLTHLM